MTRRLETCLVLAALAVCAGCDYANGRAAGEERVDRQYQAAMAEYAAGRLDKAAEAFEKVVRAHPGNASARFQLGCLLQDRKKDYLGAICNYREYVMLMPAGDRVAIANERLGACERALAPQLVAKYKLGGSVAQDEANARLAADKARLTADLAKSREENETLKDRLAAVQRENARVRRMVLAGAQDEPGERTVAKADELPEETDEAAVSDLDRVKTSDDIAKLIAEEKEETAQAAPFGNTVRTPPPPKATPLEPPHEPRPATYVVQEGDTLFKLAIRFYGRRSAWSMIREANKATVSSDGRIRAGQTLRLP